MNFKKMAAPLENESLHFDRQLRCDLFEEESTEAMYLEVSYQSRRQFALSALAV